IDMSSFIIETGEGVNRPQIFLRNFLPACLYSERIKEDKAKRKKAFAEDRNALNAMEKLLSQRVEKASIEHAESPLQALEKRLLILETENAQLQQKLRELEAERERINQELQQQREEEKNHLIEAETEKERFILDQQQQEKRGDKLLAGAILASTTIRGADASPAIPSGKSPSRLPEKGFLTSGCLLYMAVLFAGTTCLFAGLFFFGKPVLAYFDSSTARVTITQASYTLTDNYIFTGVSRSISKAQAQSVTVPATNLIVIPGKKAIGTLTFHNTQSPCNIARIIPAGTLFTNSHGISVATDRAVTLGTSCNASAPAHAVKIGPEGNIGAHSIKQTYHATVIVDNPVAFVGGQFAQSYTTVQQSDIDHARNSLEGRTMQEALSGLHAQLQANEQYTSLPACTSKAIADHQAYDIATQVTVVVMVACTAEAYKPQEIISQSQQMLNTRAQALFGPSYMLSGNIHSTITHVATDAKHDTLITTVASGLWTYQVSRARTDQLAQLLTGMDKHDAQYTISRQKGVQSVSISVSNNGNTMPSKAKSIHIAYVTSLVMLKESQSKV
ncbi:MAG TPA: baseplate J/gp47 family protein, partial [Ktedonobacteraceae bacterium]|nr:baseplate J/gp47 family protein [Ktedonobacteraceae bacterium]